VYVLGGGERQSFSPWYSGFPLPMPMAITYNSNIANSGIK
jgi:hypothetical protein